MNFPRAYFISENSVLIYFSDTIDKKILVQIASFRALIKDQLGDLIIDYINAYNSLLLVYDINRLDFSTMSKTIDQILVLAKNNLAPSKNHPLSQINKCIEIPVYYDKSVAPDLEYVLKTKKLTLDEFIQLHSRCEYLVYAVGFAPNFAYLGILSSELKMMRHKKPRAHVDAGSVAIAERQTAVYPDHSPGGWHLIGKTPIDLSATSDIIFEMGDVVRFNSISEKEFLRLSGIK